MKKFFVVVTLVLSLIVQLVPVSQAKLPEELTRAVDLIYNAQFTEAKSILSKYITAHPQDPAGYLMSGMLKEWYNTLNNVKNDAEILADYQQANQLAAQELNANPGNIDKMILLGNTYMYMAKKYVDKGEKFKAGKLLKKAKELMNQSIQMNPNAYDAYFALGVFNYFSERVPSGFKWLAKLMGFNGNKETGLEYLKKAAENNNITQGDAAFLLFYIYSENEKNYPVAIQFNQILKDRFPKNIKFLYDEASVYYKAKDFEKAKDRFQNFLSLCEESGNSCHNKYKFLAHYNLAEFYIGKNNLAMAKPYIKEAVKTNVNQYQGYTANVDLWQGLVAKTDGKQFEAIDFFKRVEKNRKYNEGAWSRAQQELQSM